MDIIFRINDFCHVRVISFFWNVRQDVLISNQLLYFLLFEKNMEIGFVISTFFCSSKKLKFSFQIISKSRCFFLVTVLKIRKPLPLVILTLNRQFIYAFSTQDPINTWQHVFSHGIHNIFLIELSDNV